MKYIELATRLLRLRTWGDALDATQSTALDQQMAEIAIAMRNEGDRVRVALPTCEQHKPDGSARSRCVICSGQQLEHALSRISYLCGEPNEMEVSDYDVSYDDSAVVEKVRALKQTLWSREQDIAAKNLLIEQLNKQLHRTVEQAALPRLVA